MISVLCLSFGNENVIRMCIDLLIYVLVTKSGLIPEGNCANHYNRAMSRGQSSESLYPVIS
ncbi:hypothetical protein F383_12811 [Gossypium arboreum]|uniref:Uncharacterized protein n=1 Tax=Gossypium arboreum TaxID=29729 RepID=A0A0B0PM20_GOSAR|nr:hypothetical protein F383_12811 [Gossypium arboreum]